MRIGILIANLLFTSAAAAPLAAQTHPISFESLLHEMIDREAAARWPSPAYTCAQASSYDRASTSPDDAKTWFANQDVSQFLRVESSGGRNEWVLMDAAGPGAVVRIWSANPKGNLRFYLDGADTPAIQAPMTDLLGGKWRGVGAPLSATRSRGWNLYLPIPYAKHCKITCDSDGFYYQVNYRTYESGTAVETLTVADLERSGERLQHVQQTLASPPGVTIIDDARYTKGNAIGQLLPGKQDMREFNDGPAALRSLRVIIRASNRAQALRSTILRIEFDGEHTVWCPIGAFFGADVDARTFQDWWRSVEVHEEGASMSCRWIMPYRKSCRITIENLGAEPVGVALETIGGDWNWDDRSMHFHATWRHEFPIPTRPMRDWNYVAINGRGVFMGDSLAVMNPNETWWGEGDEKFYVDGESFPSHFGTGTEDYYGYAWCSWEPFVAPFHSQSRCDGYERENNWGHTTVSRVRSLDAIPFTTSLRFDMEVWHWKECEVAYGATCYFYASPGATTNRQPQPDEAARAIPQPPPLPPPYKVAGAIECEGLEVAAISPGLKAVVQGGHGPNLWSGDKHLWVQGRRVGDFIELRVPAAESRPQRVTIYATRSWDYGIVRFSVNGQRAGEDVDLFNAKAHAVAATGPIELGEFTPVDGAFRIRVEVVGGNERAEGNKSFFGVDCVALSPR